jgi:hypothetical protein
VGWVVAVALLVVIAAAQEWFLETHRARYGLWRPARERRLWMSRDERRLAWQALIHRNPDRRVEATRLIVLAVIGIAFAALLRLVVSGGLDSIR